MSFLHLDAGKLQKEIKIEDYPKHYIWRYFKVEAYMPVNVLSNLLTNFTSFKGITT